MIEKTSQLDKDLKKIVGKRDFTLLKNLSNKDKKAIISVSPHISLANSVYQCFWLGNKKHETIYANPVYREICGYSLKECLGEQSDFCFDKESKKAVKKHHKLREQGVGSQYESDIVRKTGEVVTVMVSGSPTKDGGTMGIFTNMQLMDKLSRNDQELVNIIGFRDLKVVKKLLTPKELAILVKYKHAITFSNTMEHSFWLGKKGHKTLYANEIYQKSTGYRLEECIGQPADFCFDEESKRTIAEHHKLRKAGISSKYEATYLTKKGKKIPVLVVGAPNEEGGSYGMHINLTTVKKLHEDQKISDQIIRKSSEAIVILNEKQQIQMWNTGAEKIFGYDEKEVLGKKLSTLIVPLELTSENLMLINEVEKRDHINNFETKRLRKNNEKVDVSLSISRVKEKKKTKGFLVTYHDITSRKKVNTELQKRFEAIQDAYKELGIQKRQSDYMNEIINLATSDESSKKLGKMIVSAAYMLTKCDGATLRLLGPKKKTLRLDSSIGVDHKWLDKNKITLENSLAQDAFETTRPIIIQDLYASRKHQGIKMVKTHSFKTLILIPFMLEDQLIGSLSLYATDPGKFRLIETEFLEHFGKLCSLALYSKNK